MKVSPYEEDSVRQGSNGLIGVEVGEEHGTHIRVVTQYSKEVEVYKYKENVSYRKKGLEGQFIDT